MSLTCTVATVDRTTWASTAEWTVHHSLNSRSTLTMTFVGGDSATGYRPTRGQEIAIANGATTHFGGVITRIDEDGAGTFHHLTIEAAGYAVYADWCYVTYSHVAGSTLKEALTDLITNYLTTYSIALDASQADGPTLPALNWERSKASDVLQDLCDYADGYVWRVDASKKLLLYVPGASAAAWNITDATVFAEDAIPVVSETDEEYADTIILVCGDSSQVSKDQQWTGSQGVVDGALVYFVTDYPAPDNYQGIWPNQVTVSGRADISGPSAYSTTGTAVAGWAWSWDWQNHRLIFNTAIATAPAAGATIDIPAYTAQYPFTVTSTTTPPPALPHEAVYTAPDVMDLTAGQTLADAYVTKLSTVKHEIKYGTYVGGLLVGTAQTVTLTSRNLSAVAFLITDIEIRQIDPDTLRYDVTAQEGTTKLPGWTNYWKSLGGTGSATGSIAGTAPATVTAGGRKYASFGGAIGRGVTATGWQPAAESKPKILYSADYPGGIATAHIWRAISSTSDAVQARIAAWDVASSSWYAAGTGVSYTGTDVTAAAAHETISVTVADGAQHRIELTHASAAETASAHGYVE